MRFPRTSTGPPAPFMPAETVAVVGHSCAGVPETGQIGVYPRTFGPRPVPANRANPLHAGRFQPLSYNPPERLTSRGSAVRARHRPLPRGPQNRRTPVSAAHLAQEEWEPAPARGGEAGRSRSGRGGASDDSVATPLCHRFSPSSRSTMASSSSADGLLPSATRLATRDAIATTAVQAGSGNSSRSALGRRSRDASLTTASC
jgi:hypothetical protein